MEHPIDGSRSFGPWPVSVICFMASNWSRRYIRNGRHPRSIEATSVLQLVLCVEAEEIGRALWTIGACHFLGRIDHVWEGELVTLCERLHVVEGVLGIGFGVVWHDGDRPDADLA